MTTQHYRINFHYYLRLCLVTLSLGLTQASYGEDLATTQRPVIEMGVYAFQNAADLSAGYLALEKDLNAEMHDYQVHINVFSFKEIEQKLQNNQLDVLFTNPGLFQQLRQTYAFSAPIATVQRSQNEQLLTSLGGVIFELNTPNPVKDLHQLIGKRIAIPATSNTGAYVLPLYELYKAGIDKSKLSFIETQDNDNVVRTVLNGDADIGFVRTGILESWMQRKLLDASQLHIIHQRNLPSFPFIVSTELMAEWPIYSLAHTDPEAIKQLTIALFRIHKQLPSAQLLGINGFIPPVDCHLLEQILRTLNLPPFNQADVPNWQEIWQAHWQEIALFFASMLVLLISFAWALLLRKRVQANADQLQSVLNATNTGTWTWYLQTDKLIIDMNWATMLGYDAAELAPDIGTWNQLLHPDDYPVFKTAYQQYINGESTQYDITVRLQHKAGHWLWIHAIGSFIECDDQGVPLVMQGTHQDVTLAHTQRLLLEQARIKENALTSLSQLAEDRSATDFVQAALGLLEQTTESQLSFLHLVNEKEGVISFMNWSTQTLADYAHLVDKVHTSYPIKETGVWAEAISERRMIIRNNYAAQHQHLTQPEGHPELNRLMLLPFIVEQQVVMLIGVANKATPYLQQDSDMLSLFAKETWRLIQQQQAQAALKQAALVFDVSLEGILITDANSNIINVNPAFEYISGYSKAEVLGKNPRLLQSGRQDKLFYQTMWQAINTHGLWRGEVWNRRKNGALYPEHLTISAIRDQHNNVVNYVAIFSDISQQKEQQARLEKLIHYDPLTELPNRLLLTERIHQVIASAIRQPHSMALLFIDLDGFKQINDINGHDTGDILLVEVARRFKQALRAEDTIARLGGDEFVAVISQLQTVIELYPLINRLLDAAATPVLVHGAELHVSASIGVRFYQPKETETALSEQALLSQADKAMYHAKAAGKNQFYFYDESP